MKLPEDLRDPLRVCRILADALRSLHAQPVAGSGVPVSCRYARYMTSADGPYTGGFYDPSVYMDG